MKKTTRMNTMAMAISMNQWMDEQIEQLEEDSKKWLHLIRTGKLPATTSKRQQSAK